MTYEMALLESKMEGELRGEERGLKRGFTEGTKAVAVKKFRKGKSFDEVREFIDLPLHRLEELANGVKN